MDRTPEYWLDVLDAADLDCESLTYLVVAGGTRESVLSALGTGADALVVDVEDLDFENFSAYAVAEVDDGVIAIEHSGYADPSPKVLALMSAGGRVSAVARSNIMAHERFGCARDGVVVFDSDEFAFVDREQKKQVPPELIDLFDAAWIDLDEQEDVNEAGLAHVLTAMTMATVFTGVIATAQDLQRARDGGYYLVRTLTYWD